MADVNQVVLIGRLTRDADLRYTSNGKAVSKFSLAVNEKRKVGDEWKEEAGFFEIVLWGQLGESLNQYLIKGKQVAVTGKLTQERWEQDGQNRSKVVVTAVMLQLLGGGSGGGNSGGGNGGNSGTGNYGGQKDTPAPKASDDGFTDDIPLRGGEINSGLTPKGASQ
jgi:single-strand DNA-binding protein